MAGRMSSIELGSRSIASTPCDARNRYVAALPTGAAAAAGPAPEAASIRSDCSAIWWIERDTGGKSVASEMRKARERELSRRRLLLSFDGENGIASGVRQRARAEVGHRQRESRESATLVLLPVAPASHARPRSSY